MRVQVPKSLQTSYSSVYLAWDVEGAESLVCDEDGCPIQGLSCKRKEMKLPEECGD